MDKKILFTVCATAAMASAQSTANIDDFEDGNGLAKTGKDDAWYAYNDKNDQGASTYSNVEDQYGLVVVLEEAAADGSKYGAGLTGIKLVQGDNRYDPYVVLGLNVAGGLSGCTTISYKYKGAGHNLKAVMDGDEMGALTEYNRHSKALAGSTAWKTASVPVSQLAQDKGWGTTVALKMADVVQLAWEVKGEATSNYLYIDDVNCAGYAGGSSSNPGGGTTNPPAGTTATIDDFDDGNTTAESLGKKAYWYLYSAGGSFTNTQGTDKSWDMIATDGTNSYAAMTGISGITPGDTTYPSVGMEIAFDEGILANCTAVRYDYKGSGHHLRASVAGVKANAGYEHVAPDQNAASAWKTVTVSTMSQPEWVAEVAPGSIKAFSWNAVSKLTWVVDEKLSAANLGTELAIDNVKCVGTLPSVGIAAAKVAKAFNASLQGNALHMTIAKAGIVKVQVFDMMGHAVENHSEKMAAGSFVHTFGAMPSGSYVVRVQQGSAVKTMKMQVK